MDNEPFATTFASELAKYPRVIRPASFCGTAFRTTAPLPSSSRASSSASSAAAPLAAAAAAAPPAPDSAAAAAEALDLVGRGNFWHEFHGALAAGAGSKVADAVRSEMRVRHRQYVSSFNLEDIEAFAAATTAAAAAAQCE